MQAFLTELKRRHIYHVGAAYAVVAWVLLQLVNNVAPILELPPWIARAMLLFLILGFPIALIFAWIHQLVPAPASTSAERTTGKSVRPVAAWRFLPGKFGFVSGGTANRASAISPAVLLPQLASVSIAVLPFVNLSHDREQEFFSDGMTEEITAALAQVKGLRVVGRTSAFQFKGENKDLRAIGQALGATHLIEGSVRKAGDRVRITAQLIHAQDNAHLWAQNYNRELTDVFAVQEDIAQAIAGALRVPLGLKQGEVLVSSRTGDLESYQDYLRARALVRARGTSITQAIATLEPLVARDPAFAPAWALLAYAYFLLPTYYSGVARTGSVEAGRLFVQSSYDKAETAARRAIQLDPKNAAGYGALATIQTQRGKWAEAEELFHQALALDPGEPEALYGMSVMLASMARIKESLRIGETLQRLEPFVPNYNVTLAGHMLMGGEIQTPIAILESLPQDAGGGYFRNMTLAAGYAVQGRFAEAADTLLAIPQPNVVSRQSVEDAARLLRSAPMKAETPRKLPALEGGLNFVYAYLGVEDCLMDFPERIREITGGGTIPFIWSPAYAGVRKTERFKSHIRAVGLLDYWRAKGWPDLCRPTTGDDFVCE